MSQQVYINQYPTLLLVFGMSGCDHCSSWIPVFQAAAQRHPNIPAFAIDCNKQPDAADHFKVQATPTTLILQYGRVVQRHEGAGSPADAEKLFRDAERGY